MSERGVFAVDRGLFTDPLFAAGPYDERSAWCWLLAEASWKPRRVRGQSGMIALARGQLAHSIRFMAEAWGWHRSKVERFMDRLEQHGAIKTAVETGRTVITICKYDLFQRCSLPVRDTIETGSRQGRDELESRENIKDLPPSQAGADAREPTGAEASPAAAPESAAPDSERLREVPAPVLNTTPARDSVPGPTRFPVSWEAEELEIEIAGKVGWSRDHAIRQFSRFRDWCLIRNEVSHDWLASWRRWCDNPLALQRETARANRAPQRHPDDRPATGRAARLQELARQHKAQTQDTRHVDIQPAGDALCIVPPADPHGRIGGRHGGEVPVQSGGGPGPSPALLRAASLGAFDARAARALRRQRHPEQ